MVFVQTQLIGDRSGYRLGVAGQHHGLADACGLQAPDGLRAVGLDHVRDEQITGILPLDGHMHEGARLGHFRGGEAQFCPDRAAGYNSNIWECRANFSYFADHHYTYYFPVPREMCGKEFKIHILGLDEGNKKYGVNVYLCDDKTEVTGIEADVEF